MKPLTERQAAFLAEQGLNPASYQLDETTGEVVDMSEAAATAPAKDPNAYSMLGELAKSFGRGIVDPLAETVKFAGNTIGNVGEMVGLADPGAGRRSPITALGRGMEDLAARYMPESDKYAEENPTLAGISGGLGQAVGMLGPAGLARKYGMKAVKGIAAALGGGMEGEETLERSEARGDTPTEQTVKSLGSAIGSGLIEHKLGIGKIADKFLDPASTTLAEFVKKRLADLGIGASQGTAQQALQDMLVEGKTDFDSLVKAGGVEGVVQAVLGGSIDVGKKMAGPPRASNGSATDTATPESDLYSAAPEAATTDTVATPWKARELSDEYVQHILGQDEWKPVIATEFDDAVGEAKKRKILSRPLIEKLYESPNPLQALDDIVRTPGGVPTAEPRRPLSADEIEGLRNIKADDKLPLNTPLLRSVQQLRKANLPFDDADLQALNNAPNQQKADEIVNAIFLKAKQAQKPMNAAEATTAILQGNLERFGKELDTDIKRVETAEAGHKKLAAQLEKATVPPGERWMRQAELDAAGAELNQARTELLKKYLSSYNPPAMALQTVPGQPSHSPLQGPAIPGSPLTPPTDPSVAVDPITYNPTRNVPLLPETAASTPGPSSVIQGAPLPPVPMGDAPNPAGAVQANVDYAAQQGGVSQTPEQRLFDFQSQYGIIEGYKRWEGEYGHPFVEPPVEVKVASQVAAESDPASWGVAMRKSSLPAGTEILPDPDKYYRSIQRPEEIDNKLRHLDKGKIWQDAFVLEIKGDQETFNIGANNSYRAHIKPENVERIIVDLNAYADYPTAYVKELQQRFPNAEVINAVSNDTESGYVVKDIPWGDQPAENAGATRQMIAGVDPVRQLYKALGSLTSSLGSHSAPHAYAAAKMEHLFKARNKFQEMGHKAHEEFKEFLDDPDVRAALQAEKYNPADFPAKWRPLVPKFNKFREAFQNIQNANQIATWERDANGRLVPRKAVHIPGYFWAKIDQAVYDARRTGGPEWDKYRADFVKHWKTKNAKRIGRMSQAAIDAEIETALDNMFKPFAAARMDTGEPEFAAVRREHGIGIPPSWWDSDLNAATSHYINRWGMDMGYGTVVQNDPIMRKLFGIKEDAMGRPTAATDPKSFAEVKDRAAFEMARKFGRRVGATWEADMNRTKAEFTKPFETITGDDTIKTLSASYRQAPGSTGYKGDEVMNSLMQLAGNTLLQAKSAARDVGNAVFTVYEYVPVSEYGTALKDLVKAIAAPKEAIARSRAAGAQQSDQYAHEAAGVIGGAIGKAARAMRAFSLRNPADAWSKALVYNTIHDIVLNAESTGQKHPLVDEFVLEGRGNSTPAQLAEKTAATIVNRAQPAYDVRSLGPAMIPQNRTILGTIFSLARWPVARFNTWYEDAWKPALEGHPQRLLKSLLVAGVAGSVITQELLTALTSREPQHLTLREWWNLPDNERDMKKFAESLFGYVQAQGTLGILGNILNEGYRLLIGKPTSLSGEIKLQFPPAIVAEKVAQTTRSFAGALREGNVGLYDIADYGLELAKASQNVQVFEQWLGSKPEYRDRRIFEELTGQSALTGDFKKVDNEPAKGFADPFSLNNRLLRAAGRGPDEVKKLVPALAEQTKAGSPVKIKREVMSPFYYAELAQRRGPKEAQRQLKEDMAREAAAREVRVLSDVLSDVLSPPDIGMSWPE